MRSTGCETSDHIVSRADRIRLDFLLNRRGWCQHHLIFKWAKESERILLNRGFDKFARSFSVAATQLNEEKGKGGGAHVMGNWKSNQQFAACPKQTHKYRCHLQQSSISCQNGNKGVAVQSLLLTNRWKKALFAVRRPNHFSSSWTH